MDLLGSWLLKPDNLFSAANWEGRAVFDGRWQRRRWHQERGGAGRSVSAFSLQSSPFFRLFSRQGLAIIFCSCLCLTLLASFVGNDWNQVSTKNVVLRMKQEQSQVELELRLLQALEIYPPVKLQGEHLHIIFQNCVYRWLCWSLHTACSRLRLNWSSWTLKLLKIWMSWCFIGYILSNWCIIVLPSLFSSFYLIIVFFFIVMVQKYVPSHFWKKN